MINFDLLKKASHYLLEYSQTCELDARILLAKVLGVSDTEMFLYNKPLSKTQESHFWELVERRKKMEPIAYIVGHKEFYTLDLYVDHNVLIPRPETEILVENTLLDIKKKFQNKDKIKILDLGTGSGAISIAIAQHCSNVEIVATDISQSALSIAKRNVLKYKLQNRIKLVCGDWYDALPSDIKYDYIISNPPYIAHNELDQVAIETQNFEPDLALYAVNNGLSEYYKIIENAKYYIKQNGILALEIGYQQKKSVSNILSNNNFQDIQIHYDLANHPRAIFAICS